MITNVYHDHLFIFHKNLCIVYNMCSIDSNHYTAQQATVVRSKIK